MNAQHSNGRRPGVVILDREAGTDAMLLGGKGANLARLVRWGFRVPAACVITAPACRQFHPDGHSLEDGDARHLAEFLSTGKDRLFAVRSSAVAEDSSTASFAGQLETFLNVRATDVETHVYRVVQSHFAARVEAYRQRMGVGSEPAVAVIVQEMLAPDYAGVVFTVDPIHRTHLAIEVVQGIGDKLMSGEVTPSSYRMGRDTKEIITDHEPFPVTAGLLHAIAETSLRIEALQGMPQDVEFAVADGEIHLLQARPIAIPLPAEA